MSQESLVDFLNDFIIKQFQKQNKALLFVDDDFQNLQVLSMYAQETNIQYYTAESGAQALQLINENYDQIAGIIIDSEMPEMNGFECIQQIRFWEQLNREEKKVKIVMLSGNSGEEPEQQAMQSGADGYYVKPLSLSKFRNFCIKLNS